VVFVFKVCTLRASLAIATQGHDELVVFVFKVCTLRASLAIATQGHDELVVFVFKICTLLRKPCHATQNHSQTDCDFLLPCTGWHCIYVRRYPHTFIHRDVCKWHSQNPIMDCPRSQADAVRGFG